MHRSNAKLIAQLYTGLLADEQPGEAGCRNTDDYISDIAWSLLCEPNATIFHIYQPSRADKLIRMKNHRFWGWIRFVGDWLSPHLPRQMSHFVLLGLFVCLGFFRSAVSGKTTFFAQTALSHWGVLVCSLTCLVLYSIVHVSMPR